MGKLTATEPLIKLKVGPHRQEIEFLVDTGAERSTLQKLPMGCMASKEKVVVIGAKGDPFKVSVIKDVEIESQNKVCLRNLLLVEEADYNLLGRDMIVALGINIVVKNSELVIKIFHLTPKDERKIDPRVWHSKGEVGKLNITPIKIEIENPEDPIRIKQYPIPIEGRRGLKLVIDDLLRGGTLEPCMSQHNTPILAVKKADGSFRLVQDLRAVNARTRTRFPVVANPYTLLNRLSPEDVWYSVIDLKDAFWTCPLNEGSRNFFAFQWEDPDTNRNQQLRWTVLPQGFVESPNLFGQALEQLLTQFIPEEETKLLQYVDDLLIAGTTEEQVKKSTISLLNFLGQKGLKVSKSKLQFTEPEVKYLGHWISQGKKKLDPDRVAGILILPAPKTKTQIRQFLGLLGYCRQWIEGFSEKVKFLYERLNTDRLKWTTQDESKFQELKNALITAPVLTLPDTNKEFQLFVDVSGQTAQGVLTQEWAEKKKPIGFLSKILDPVSRGWPTCLQAIVAVALLVGEAKKITFGAPLIVYTPHDVRNILQQKAEKWLTDSRLLKYEAMLISSPGLELRTTTAQNPAQFLFGEPTGELFHNCIEAVELQTKVRPDLEDQELEGGEKWFIDGSSKMVEGKRKSGYAIINGTTGQIIESGPLQASWSVQACELFALLRALKGLKGKRGTIYTDSKYAFGVVHTFGKIWEERGLINTKGKGLIHGEIIRQILEAVREPQEISVVHVKGHQTGWQFHTRGNNLADKEAKRAALLTVSIPEIFPKEPPEVSVLPSEKELEDFRKELRRRGLIPQSATLGFPIHKIRPGDKVLIKVWRELPLSPHWEGPFLVLLTTDTAVRTAEKGWTHSSRAKKVPDCNSSEWKVTTPPGELKIKLRRQHK
ncbi:uncharacterized protein LOC131588511 [Poecile atricapillus]|uniref:uncharacterized protein LOC131588511 n=1 Tax=Poecile atricapillus TaxID=48891 RepID=UPI00273A014F|nr:uncharacterized protein LOC131588511 [Poecile atricapillus]